jgi:hypothetical protein
VPEQKLTFGPGEATAAGLTVTTTEDVAVQPAGLVAVTVYVWVMGAPVVLGKVTVGCAAVALLRPVAGLQA